MHMTKPGRPLFLLAVISALGAVACGIAIKRDLSTVPVGTVGFEDMCGLQDYFDGLEAKVTPEPAVISAMDLEGGDGQHTVRGGRARLRFEGLFLLRHAKRVLNENWRRLPDELQNAEQFDIEVVWAEKAGVRRVVTDREAELYIGNDSWPLPYHVCLSEMLYGAPLYKQRRAIWNLPNPLPVEPGAKPATDGAAPGTGAADGGVADGVTAPAAR
jgi:hypothetical protein